MCNRYRPLISPRLPPWRGCASRPAALALIAALTLLASSAGRASAATRASAAELGALPPVWLDDRGRPFDLRTLQGHSVVLTMAYATCHRVCPLAMRRLEQLQRELDAHGGSAEFLVIGYDPEHDDTAAWHQYRQSRHLTRANWHFLTGTRADVEQTARRLGFGFWFYDQHVMHDLRVVWFDEHGTPLATSEGTDFETTGPKHTEVAAR